MPLNTHQKTFIDSIIGHLLDFSPFSSKLSQQIEQLKTALTPKASKDNNYYWLGQCLLNPETNLSGLEKQTVSGQTLPVTIGEAQQYIVNQIKSKLNKANTNDLFKAIEKLIKMNMKTEFKSKSHFIPGGENPLTEMPSLRGKIHTRTLRISEKYREGFDFITTTAHVDVTITLSPTKTVTSKISLGEILNNFISDRESDDYFDNLKKHADRKALEFVGTEAIHYLYHKKLINKDMRNAALKDAFINTIITSKYYFDLLRQNNFNLNLLLGCTETQANNLTDSVLIDLIHHKAIKLSDVKNLNNAEKLVATSPAFHALLKDKKINIANLMGISQRRSKFLIQPIIANLIKQNVLTLDQAKKLPTYLLNAQPNLTLAPLNVINCDLFQNFLRKKTINWDKLSDISMRQCQLFFNENIAPLITEEIVTLKDILKLSDGAIDFIDQHPHLCHWAKQSLFNLKELNNDSGNGFIHLNAAVYAKRLHAFSMDRPYEIEGQADMLEVFLQEIPLAANDGGITTAELQEEIMGNLLPIIKDDLIHTNTKYNREQQKQIERMVQQINGCLFAQPLIWRNQFGNFISLLHEIHGVESYKTNKKSYLDSDDVMFPATKRRKCHEEKTDNSLLTLCDNLLQLEAFNQLIEAENEHAMRI